MDKQQIAMAFGMALGPAFLWLYLTAGKKGKDIVIKHLPDGWLKRVLLKKVD